MRIEHRIRSSRKPWSPKPPAPILTPNVISSILTLTPFPDGLVLWSPWLFRLDMSGDGRCLPWLQLRARWEGSAGRGGRGPGWGAADDLFRRSRSSRTGEGSAGRGGREPGWLATLPHQGGRKPMWLATLPDPGGRKRGRRRGGKSLSKILYRCSCSVRDCFVGTISHPIWTRQAVFLCQNIIPVIFGSWQTN